MPLISQAVVPSLNGSSPHPDYSGSRDVAGSVGASNKADQGRSIANAIGGAVRQYQAKKASTPTGDSTSSVPESSDVLGGILS